LKISTEEFYDYDDLVIKPKPSSIPSRDDVDISVNVLNRFTLKFPVFASPMRAIVNADFCKLFADLGGCGILHRFYDTKDEWYLEAEKISEAKIFGLSIGMNDYAVAMDFLKFNPHVILLDVANGYTDSVINFCKSLRKLIDKESPSTLLMAGNIASYEGAENLYQAGVDMVRCGIGGGCFAAGTRILMSNGYYKNIELLNVEDEIIDGNGNPTKVLGVKRTGYRKVIKYRHNKFYMPTICTAEHLHRIYDLNDYAETTINGGIKSLLKRNDALWKPVYDLRDKDFLVFPKDIYFNLKNDFEINLLDFAIKDSTVPKESRSIKSSYQLGYIFGTFLGDGCANLSDHKKENGGMSEVGSLKWMFGENETVMAEKLANCCLSVFGKPASIKNDKERKMTIVTFNYQVLARFLQQFGKKNKKKLPEEYFCANKEYLKGIIDGLIDSDGHIEKYGRYGFHNNSTFLIELFNMCSFIVDGLLPSNLEREKRSGGFTPIGNIENYNTSYTARVGTTCGKRHNDFYNAVDFLDKEYLDLVIPVYDIEVESSDHSFIANNAVVHNSLCSTRNKTGVAVPQLSAVMDSSKSDVFIVNDGGVRNAGDATKAFIAGADAVMCGSILAQTYESPAENTIFGMASRKLQDLRHTQVKSVEGIEKFIEKKMSLKDFVEEFSWDMRSTGTMINARNLQEMRNNGEFLKVGKGTLSLDKN